MQPEQLQAWFALFSAAEFIGESMIQAVKNHGRKVLTPEQYAALETAWDDDVRRSAINAGIEPEEDLPLTQKR